jgi:hypothetical protein
MSVSNMSNHFLPATNDWFLGEITGYSHTGDYIDRCNLQIVIVGKTIWPYKCINRNRLNENEFEQKMHYLMVTLLHFYIAEKPEHKSIIFTVYK